MILVMPLVGDLFARDFLPESFAGIAVEAEDRELVRFVRSLGAEPSPAAATGRCGRFLSRGSLRFLCLGFLSGGNCGEDK